MSRQVLGKRPRSNSRISPSSPSRSSTPAYKTRRITREPLTPDPTPNPKRAKASSTELELDDGSNKENIPPYTIFGPLTPTSPSVNSSSLRPQGHETAPLIGREQERTHIIDFLTPFVDDQPSSDNATSLYVSGSPGTGKTALVNEILSGFPFPKVTDATNVPVHVIYINCMALGTKVGFAGVWEHCVEELKFPKKTKRCSATQVDWSQRFGKLFQGKKCVLVLDEIDHLATSTSTSVSQVFALAASPQVQDCLRIIGISNTHTLTHAKHLSNTRTIHFEPYTAAQMKAILSARLTDLSSITKLFSPATLALLTMKIASQTGDIRTVFSVARRSLDLALAGSTSSSTITVTPAHILAALKTSHASIGSSQGKGGAETVARVRNLGLHARFALAALLLATRRIMSGLSLSGSSSVASSRKLKENANYPSNTSALGDGGPPKIDITVWHGFYTTILSRGADAAFCGVGRTEFTDLVGLLEGSGLVELTQGRGFGFKTKGGGKNKTVQMVGIANGVRAEELVRGLVGSSVNGTTEGATVDVREEEVKHVWEKEIARIGREAKAKSGNSRKADFEGAEED